MATIKTYTDLEQSKKLAKILPLDSADMHYCLEKRDVVTGYEIGITPFIKVKRFEGKGNIVNIQPAWSLAALHGVLPKGYSLDRRTNGKYYVCMTHINHHISEYDNPVDAYVAMIEKLNELNLL